MLGGIASSVRKAGGMLVVLRELPGQRRVPYLPPEEAVERRDRRVREAVRFAAEHVPHYRDMFRDEGIDPNDIRTADDLGSLPLLDRNLLQREPDRFRPEWPLRDDVLRFPTAGSTGTPVRFMHDRRSLLANIAYGEREREVEVGFVGKRYRYRVLQISHPGTADRKVRDYYKRVSFRPFSPRLHPLTVADSFETIVATLNELRPLVVRGFGTHLDLVFRTALARGIPLHRPRLVVYGGDKMAEEGVRLIEEELGTPVISRYGASEAFKIGFMCEARAGFHLHEDLTHVTLVDSDGRPAQEGAVGEIVISNLVNRGMLLLNYRLGDLGRLGGRECACGRTARLLTQLEGRVDETLQLQNGDLIHPVLVRDAIDQPGVLRFQLVQEAESRFRLKLMTADESTYAAISAAMVARLAAVLQGCEIHAERHAELTPDGRKFRAVVPLTTSPSARVDATRELV